MQDTKLFPVVIMAPVNMLKVVIIFRLYIYMYGGNDGSRYRNSLHQLDTQSWTWSELTKSGPMRKAGCGMIAFDRKLLLFGGYGIPSDSTQQGAKFIKSSRSIGGRGWTNELHLFNLKEGEGACPPL